MLEQTSDSEPSNSRMLLVGGLSRTGGSHIPFLIDGHEGFFGIPFEMHFSEAFDGPPDAEFFRTAPKDEVLKALLKGGLYHKVVLKSGHIQEGLKHLYAQKRISGVDPLDRRGFLAELGAHVDNRSMTESNYLDLISRAFIRATGGDPDRAVFIVNHSSRAILTDTAQIFDRNRIAFYIYTRRSSLDWLASLAKKNDKNHPAFRDKRYFTSLLLFKHTVDSMARAYTRKWPDRYFIVEFSDAVSRPETVIRDLHACTGLPQPDSLSTQATFRGRPVGPNTSFAQKYKNPEGSSFDYWDIPQDLKKTLLDLEYCLDESDEDQAVALATGHGLAWMIRVLNREVQGQPRHSALATCFRLAAAANRRLKKLLR